MIKDLNKISYIYDATGVKLKKTAPGNMVTEYTGNYVYKNGTLEFFNHAEGYVEKENNTYKYVYQYKDHLGNIRVSYDNSGSVSSPNASIVEEKNYYPFGLQHKGYNNVVNGTEHPYKYNGKELNEELGLDWYDYGARNYDVAIGRWMNIDPLADQMRRHSPYNYAFDNPIFYIDPDGMKPFGDYYAANGEYLGNDGIDDDKAYVVTTNQTTPVDGALQGGPTSTTVTELSVSNSELLLLASTAYGESSVANNSSEVSAIASAIINNKNTRGSNATVTSTIDGFAFAATDGNARATEFNSTSAEGRNGTFMQDAVGGAINAVNGGEDLSNGATHWAGDDVGSSSEKRATGGLNVTNASHDIHSVGSQTVSGAPVTTYWKNKAGKNTSVRGTYNYTWQTTAGHGGTKPNGSTTGTTFMKKTDNFINATGAPRY